MSCGPTDFRGGEGGQTGFFVTPVVTASPHGPGALYPLSLSGKPQYPVFWHDLWPPELATGPGDTQALSRTTPTLTPVHCPLPRTISSPSKSFWPGTRSGNPSRAVAKGALTTVSSWREIQKALSLTLP